VGPVSYGNGVRNLVLARAWIRSAVESVTLAHDYLVEIKSARGTLVTNPLKIPKGSLPWARLFVSDGKAVKLPPAGQRSTGGSAGFGRGEAVLPLTLEVWFPVDRDVDDEKADEYLAAVLHALRNSTAPNKPPCEIRPAGAVYFYPEPDRALVSIDLEVVVWYDHDET
jgi:hypothetical protein